jgi:hypothetical protein
MRVIGILFNTDCLVAFCVCQLSVKHPKTKYHAGRGILTKTFGDFFKLEKNLQSYRISYKALIFSQSASIGELARVIALTWKLIPGTALARSLVSRGGISLIGRPARFAYIDAILSSIMFIQHSATISKYNFIDLP